jgi:hypothetical protein
MHVAITKRLYKGKLYTSYLLRRTYRENGKVKHQTLGNISHLPPDLIETIRRRLKGETLPETPSGDFRILRALPHGHVAAILGVIHQLKLDRTIDRKSSDYRQLVLAMIAARIIHPGSKLATACALLPQTATTSLALELGIQINQERPLYKALDWLLERQPSIENTLAGKHLPNGSLVLYDVSSSYYTGHHCDLARFGHNRDGKNGYPQIVYGLLCSSSGCPVAIEVFQGNTADPTTLSAQVDKIRQRFCIDRVVLVGDRGMITARRIDQTLRGVQGLDWITALRSEQIKMLVEQGLVDPSLFDEQDLMEIESPDYPGERLIVCRNPFLAEQRARKRMELLAATEKLLESIATATRRTNRPLKGKEKIGVRVGKVINRHKVGKHFILEITDDGFNYQRNEKKITEEALLDGYYVIRTSVSPQTFSSDSVVQAYKGLSKVERAFRCLKTIDLHIRPIFHRLDNRVRAHVFLCMLAYYVEWHMRQKLKPVLFDDEDRMAAESLRSSVVAPAPRSALARSKDLKKYTVEGLPVQSFRNLLSDLGTVTKNLVETQQGEYRKEFYMLSCATVLQQRAFELLGVSLSR